jgi:hypothetical protein
MDLGLVIHISGAGDELQKVHSHEIICKILRSHIRRSKKKQGARRSKTKQEIRKQKEKTEKKATITKNCCR